jgi:hypothetical protein
MKRRFLLLPLLAITATPDCVLSAQPDLEFRMSAESPDPVFWFSNFVSVLPAESRVGALRLSGETQLVDVWAPVVKRERARCGFNGSNEAFARRFIGEDSWSELERLGFRAMESGDEESGIAGMDLVGRLLCSSKALESFRTFLSGELSRIENEEEPSTDSPLKLYVAAESLYFNGVHDGSVVLESVLESEESPLVLKRRAFGAVLSENRLPSPESLRALLLDGEPDARAFAWQSLSRTSGVADENVDRMSLDCFAEFAETLPAVRVVSGPRLKLFDALVSYLETSEHDGRFQEDRADVLHEAVFRLLAAEDRAICARVAPLASRLARETDVAILSKMVDDPDDGIRAHGALGFSRLSPDSIKNNAFRLLPLLNDPDERVKSFSLFSLRRGLSLPATTFVEAEDFPSLKDDVVLRYDNLKSASSAHPATNTPAVSGPHAENAESATP